MLQAEKQAKAALKRVKAQQTTVEETESVLMRIEQKMLKDRTEADRLDERAEFLVIQCEEERTARAAVERKV